MGGIVPMGDPNGRQERPPGCTGTLPATSAELSRLLTAVRRGRVLTVTGGFGAPRSLLVREMARRLTSNFCDGVAVVTLEYASGVRELVGALGTVPGIPYLPRGSADAASWLAERDMLLVLDGSDRLTPEALNWLRALLARAPGLRILAAGRYPLALEQERVHRL
ncbi:putative ATPase [Streptomyces sp. PvR034]